LGIVLIILLVDFGVDIDFGIQYSSSNVPFFSHCFIGVLHFRAQHTIQLIGYCEEVSFMRYG